MKNPLKKEYLNQYQAREDGGYTFTGAYYCFHGGSFKKRFVLLSVLLCAIGALIIASGCLNSAGMRNSFYVIIPYIGEVSAFFALVWNSVKLFTKGERVKEYIYKSAYPRIPRAALATAMLAGVSVLCSVIFIILNGPEGGVAKCVLYNVFKLLIISICIVFDKVIKNTEYVLE